MTTPPASSPRQVACPGCGGPSLYAPANPWRPFCSERCREADLGAWASEAYRMPEAATGEEPQAASEPFPRSPAGRPRN